MPELDPKKQELGNFVDLFQGAFTFSLERSRENAKKHGWVEMDENGILTALSNFDFTETLDSLKAHPEGIVQGIKELFARR